MQPYFQKYKNDGTDDRITAQLGYHFDTQLNSILTFNHDLSYFPSTETFSDYYLTTTFELRARLTEKMYTSFRTIFDYDATRAGQNQHGHQAYSGRRLDF